MSAELSSLASQQELVINLMEEVKQLKVISDRDNLNSQTQAKSQQLGAIYWSSCSKYEHHRRLNLRRTLEQQVVTFFTK